MLKDRRGLLLTTSSAGAGAAYAEAARGRRSSRGAPTAARPCRWGAKASGYMPSIRPISAT